MCCASFTLMSSGSTSSHHGLFPQRYAGGPEDVLTGFLKADGEARGRPVGVAFDRQGAPQVADDVGNRIARVTAVSPGLIKSGPATACNLLRHCVIDVPMAALVIPNSTDDIA